LRDESNLPGEEVADPASTSTSLSARSSSAEWWLIAAFVACICAPLIVQATGLGGEDVITTREKRVPAPAPRLPRDLASWSAFPRATEDWYAERFGLRNQLLYAHHWTKLQVYDKSPIEGIVIGPDDWLFTNSAGALECERGTNPMTAEELNAWRETLTARRDWLAAQGIDYAFVLVPGKAAVYPEMLPDQFARRGPSRREQFLEELRDDTDLNVIDLLPALRAARDEDTPDDHVFFPLGMHWTARGALVASEAVMQALPKRHRERAIDGLDRMTRRPSTHGDDLSFQFLVSGRFDQAEFNLRPNFERKSVRVGPGHALADHHIPTWINTERRPTRALMIRDSFGTMVLPYLAEHFSRVHDVSSVNFTSALVETLQPDIVIELFVDHTLGFHTPHQQRDFDQAALAARFEQHQHTLLAPVVEGTPPELQSLRDTPIGPAPSGMRIASDGSGSVTLPYFDWRPAQETILAIDISAPAQTFLSLYYPLEGVNAYREKQASDVPIEPGRQTVYIALPPPVANGPIALVPGRAAGDYIVHNIEVRAATR
jgi:alginate O-acetyltransferase complex protein AlgJ